MAWPTGRPNPRAGTVKLTHQDRKILAALRTMHADGHGGWAYAAQLATLADVHTSLARYSLAKMARVGYLSARPPSESIAAGQRKRIRAVYAVTELGRQWAAQHGIRL